MYIRTVRIHNFRKRNDFVLNLAQDVTLLSGQNGSGKSSVLSLLEAALHRRMGTEEQTLLCDAVSIHTSDNGQVFWDPKNGRTDYKNLLPEEFKNIVGQLIGVPEVNDLNDHAVAEWTQLLISKKPQKGIDKILLQRVQQFSAFKSTNDAYFVRKARRSEPIEGGNYDRIDAFYDILEEYFRDVNKKLNRDTQPFHFVAPSIDETRLSIGEKQLLLIFVSVFLQHQAPAFLMLDEALLGINTFWQKRILKDLRNLNPNCQILIATHSPYTLGEQLGNARIKLEDCWHNLDRSGFGASKSQNALVNTAPMVGSVTSFMQSANTSPTDNKPRIVRLKEDFLKVKDNPEYRDFDRTYHVNLRIKEEVSFALEECQEIVAILDELRIGTDVITVTTLMNRMNSLQDCKALLESVSNPDDAVMYVANVPNEITLNSMLKKAGNLVEGLDFIMECERQYKMESKFPDIITFSTLLGKANSRAEIDEVENMRRYFKISVNDIYMTRLHSKREHLKA